MSKMKDEGQQRVSTMKAHRDEKEEGLSLIHLYEDM